MYNQVHVPKTLTLLMMACWIVANNKGATKVKWLLDVLESSPVCICLILSSPYTFFWSIQLSSLCYIYKTLCDSC